MNGDNFHDQAPPGHHAAGGGPARGGAPKQYPMPIDQPYPGSAGRGGGAQTMLPSGPGGAYAAGNYAQDAAPPHPHSAHPPAHMGGGPLPGEF